MPLTELTKITGPGIKTDTNFVGNNAHFTGITTADNSLHVGTGITLSSVGNATYTGIVTASKFIGDGSDLTSLPAGLGTALSADTTKPLNAIYYVNDILHITENTIVDVPGTSTNAYTQYSQIEVDDDLNLTVEDNVNFIPDVLSLFP